MKPSQTLRRRISPIALAALLCLSSSCKDAKDTKADDAPKQGEGAPTNVDATEPVTPTPAPQPLPQVAPPTVDSAPIADVGDVVATVQLPTGTNVQDLMPIVEKFAPGMSAMVRMQLPTMLADVAGMSLDGAKLDAPISIVAVEPSLATQPLALLVHTKDLAKLQAAAKGAGLELRERDGLALIGPSAVVAAAETFAFTNLKAAPDHTEIVIYPPQLAASLGPQIEAAMAMMDAQLAGTNPGMQGLMRMYVDALLGVTKQTERFVISVSAGQTSTDLHARAYPLAGSELAAFVAAQTPSNHPLLAKLPSTATQTMVMSGEIHSGPTTASLIGFSVAAMESMYSGAMPAETWTEIMTAWADTLDGQFAMSMTLSLPTGTTQPGMSIQALTGATDADGMRKAWRDMVGALAKGQDGVDMMGMKVAIDYRNDVVEHDGVGVDLYTTNIDVTSLPEDQRAMIEATNSASQSVNFATFDKFGAIATTDEDNKSMRTLIDAARGKGQALEPTPGLASALAISTERGESLFSYFDMTTVAPDPSKMPFRAFVMAFGKQGDALAIRFSLQN
ncbi:hypothetical protein DB30_05453 [Enhygromyxa salina]|uniref:DUF3352 domain-containing protein n=1 Tax=Enhygromyxa salina TaxID=215803 RepID=A0A0C1ZD08_9BACT|nr:hypothetical protein [Enhygromyxa salina]KIG15579.1 hypothetical protein DB30_05453 [Enhygromyxa salina]